MRFLVTGYRDYRVQYSIEVEAECEDDIDDQLVGEALLESTTYGEDWDVAGADIQEEQIESIEEVGT